MQFQSWSKVQGGVVRELEGFERDDGVTEIFSKFEDANAQIDFALSQRTDDKQ